MNIFSELRGMRSTDDCGVCKGRGYRVWYDEGQCLAAEVCEVCGGSGKQPGVDTYTFSLSPSGQRESVGGAG